MMLPDELSHLQLETRHFGLRCRLNESHSRLKMTMRLNILTTAAIENVVHHLELLIPGVLETQCFNDQQLPFRKEVENTEIGHLFEHVFLENLCRLTVQSGVEKCSFSGETKWNWRREPRGVFHIWVSAGYGNRLIYYEALSKSAQVMDLLLSTALVAPLGRSISRLDEPVQGSKINLLSH